MRIRKTRKSFYRTRNHSDFYLFPIGDESFFERILKWILIGSIVLLFVALIVILIVSAVNKVDTTEIVVDQSTTSSSGGIPKPEPPLESPIPEKPSIPTAPAAPQGLQGYRVTRVIDGDTIVVNNGGGDQKVRLIGIDTPETKDSRKPVECYGPEASSYLTAMLTGEIVYLERDASQDDVDYYGRLLRYVFYNNQNVNFDMILNGYANEYLFNNPYKYREYFEKAENYAKENQVGLWSPTTCNGLR